MTDIPKTIEDNGHTLTFSDIEWTPETEETDNLGTMETTYTAVVTYTGTATSSRTTGYTVTATYAWRGFSPKQRLHALHCSLQR